LQVSVAPGLMARFPSSQSRSFCTRPPPPQPEAGTPRASPYPSPSTSGQVVTAVSPSSTCPSQSSSSPLQRSLVPGVRRSSKSSQSPSVVENPGGGMQCRVVPEAVEPTPSPSTSRKYVVPAQPKATLRRAAPAWSPELAPLPLASTVATSKSTPPIVAGAVHLTSKVTLPPLAAFGLDCTTLPLSSRVLCPATVAKAPTPPVVRKRPPDAPVPVSVTRTVTVSPGSKLAGVSESVVLAAPVPWHPMQLCDSMPPPRASAGGAERAATTPSAASARSPISRCACRPCTACTSWRSGRCGTP
jgi:hypothetical protein